MMKAFKIIMFGFIFVILFYFFSFLFLPLYNVKEFGLIKVSQYQILREKPETIDVLFVGDSLVYSSVSPMEIYGSYGITSYDLSQSAMLIQDSIKEYEIAVQCQKPKVVFFETNFFFRNIKNATKYDSLTKKLIKPFPLISHHNNWKKFFSKNSIVNNKIDVYKGYKKNETLKAGKNDYYMDNKIRSAKIPEANFEYIDKLMKISEEYGVKVVFLGLPSQVSWNNKKSATVEELAKSYGVTYINLNLVDDLDIDWTLDTRDGGDHVNHLGAKVVSQYLGQYISDNFDLKDRRSDSSFKEWNVAFELYDRAEKK